eukprot:jgi/Mesvir1/15956/Mv08271-RA.1
MTEGDLEGLLDVAKRHIDQLQSLAYLTKTRLDSINQAGEGGAQATAAPSEPPPHGITVARALSRQLRNILRALTWLRARTDEALAASHRTRPGDGCEESTGGNCEGAASHGGPPAAGDSPGGSRPLSPPEGATARAVVTSICNEIDAWASSPDGLLALLANAPGLPEIGFLSAQVHDASVLASSTGYSKDNFAYGSTPFSAWLQLFRAPCLTQALSAVAHPGHTLAAPPVGQPAPHPARKTLQVWGSSLGWLVFYAALTLDPSIRVVGFELMPSLVDVAEELRRKHGVDNASFVQGDMLDAPLDDASVLMLTSQCWDADLRHKVATKLGKELPVGTLVVDYTAYLSTVPALLSCQVEHTEELPVSWNAHNVFYVFRKT